MYVWHPVTWTFGRQVLYVCKSSCLTDEQGARAEPPPHRRKYKTGASARTGRQSGAFDSSTSRSFHWASSGLVALRTGVPVAELPRDDQQTPTDLPTTTWRLDLRVPDTVTSGVPDHLILSDALTPRGQLSGHTWRSVSQPVYRWTGAPVIGPRASSTVASGVPNHPTPGDASTWDVGSPDRPPTPVPTWPTAGWRCRDSTLIKTQCRKSNTLRGYAAGMWRVGYLTTFCHQTRYTKSPPF